MKYLAILRDSLREAIDAKVFYVMLGLSGMVILLIACIGFRPEPPDKALRAVVQSFPGSFSFPFGNVPTPIHYEIEDFEQLNDTGKPWDGKYRFKLVARDSEENAGAFRAVAFMSALQVSDAELTEQDRETRKRVGNLYQEYLRQPPQAQARFLKDRLGEEVTRVTNAQMERFVKEQFAAHGHLEATEVRVQSAKPTEVVFEVVAQGKANTYPVWPHTLSFFGIPTQLQMPIAPLVLVIESFIVGQTGAAVALLASTIITAFFIPNMLRKGTVDLILAKPIRRTFVLIYKYVGGLSFMFLNTAFIVVGIWMVIGLRSGLWGMGFLLFILTLTFEFAMFYAISALFGVLTRSPIVAILAACIMWVVLFVADLAHGIIEYTRPSNSASPAVYAVSDVVHFVLPHYKDLDNLANKFIATDLLKPEDAQVKLIEQQMGSISWGESLAVSTAWIVVMLALACWRFATKDY